MDTFFATILRLNGDALNPSMLTLPPTEDAAPISPTAGIATSRPVELMHDDWSLLLDPLDADLRAKLLKYGDLAQATYDGFDRRHWSPHCGTCLHGLRRLLPALGLAEHGYQVTAFLYATCDVAVPHWLERPLHAEAWEGHANWIGYVSVSRAAEAQRVGYREIVVAWRGTISLGEWLLDMKTGMVPFEVDDAGGKDHRGAMVAKGFHSMYTSRNAEIKYGARSAQEQVAGELARLVRHFGQRDEEVRVTVTGHSLGGALALLAARDVAAAHPGVPVRAVTFCAPRVGNADFCDGLESRGVRVLRVVVRHDVVPSVPSVPQAVVYAPFSKPLDKLWDLTGRPPAWAYVHFGDVIELEVARSPFLKHAYDAQGFHNLETCLHLLHGRESAAGEFRAVDVHGGGRRDLALVNKTSNMLRHELRIPPWWYEPANYKGLVRNELGMWVMGEREDDDLPVPDAQLPLSELD